MKAAMIGMSFLLIATAALADSPDSSFLKNAAEGGMAEVELGQLAEQKALNPAVKDFGAMMIKDHTAANQKLKALAASEQVSLPDSPSMMQKASKAKLSMLSGDSFDKAYVQAMIDDHKDDIKDFQKEIAVDLTRFSGHITVTQRGVQNVEERQQIQPGVSLPDRAAGTSRARYEGAHEGVWGFDSWSIRNWVKQASRDAGTGDGGLTSTEREELTRLKHEVRQLRQEREILSKAAAWFARENIEIPKRSSDS